MVVNLLKEIESSYDSVELIERVKLLLWAQVMRQSVSGQIPPQGWKLRFAKPQDEISRRELFEMIVPEYQVIPYVESDRCIGGERCHLCHERCPFDAIVIRDEQISIDGLKCQACGACTAVCPHNAVVYSTFTLDQLEQEMKGLLLSGGKILEPRMIALVCQGSKPNQHRYPANMLPIELPCLMVASPQLMLRAFDLGAQGLAVISDKEGCQFGFDLDKWQGNIQFVQELLKRYGIKAERIKAFRGDDLKQELAQFAEEIAELHPTPLQSAISTEENLNLPALIYRLGKKLGIPQEGTIAAGSVPFGKLELDSTQCTGCGVCASNCPTEALTFLPSSDGDSYQMLFHHQSCVGCGQCVKICPEECLYLENILELDRLGAPPEAIFTDGLVSCEECRAPIAPMAMIESVRAKITAVGGLNYKLEVCPSCRIKADFGLPNSKIEV